jgi:hypothetical protein
MQDALLSAQQPSCVLVRVALGAQMGLGYYPDVMCDLMAP